MTDDQERLLDAAFYILAANLDDSKNGTSQEREYDDRQVDAKPSILCIDDDQDFCEALTLRFAKLNIAVVQAKDGLDGYRSAFVTPVCAIELDYMMPNGCGDYIFTRLMDNPITKDIPVIVVTGQRDKVLERRMLATGAKAYLTNPLDFGKLKGVPTAAKRA